MSITACVIKPTLLLFMAWNTYGYELCGNEKNKRLQTMGDIVELHVSEYTAGVKCSRIMTIKRANRFKI